MDTEPVRATAEIIPVISVEPTKTIKGKPKIFKKNYVTGDIIENKTIDAEEVTSKPVDLNVLYTTHMEEEEEPQTFSRQVTNLGRSSLGISKPPRTPLPNSRDIFDVDLVKVNKICLKAGLNLENNALTDAEVGILREVIALGSSVDGNEQMENRLKRYCTIKKMLKDTKPNIEKDYPKTYINIIIKYILSKAKPNEFKSRLESFDDNAIRVLENSESVRMVYNTLTNDSSLPSLIELSELTDHFNELTATRLQKREVNGGKKRTRKLNRKSKKSKKSRKSRKSRK